MQDSKDTGTVKLEYRSEVHLSPICRCAVQVADGVEDGFGSGSVAIGATRKAIEHRLGSVGGEFEDGPSVKGSPLFGGAVKVPSRVSCQTSIGPRSIRTGELVQSSLASERTNPEHHACATVPAQLGGTV